MFLIADLTRQQLSQRHIRLPGRQSSITLLMSHRRVHRHFLLLYVWLVSYAWTASLLLLLKMKSQRFWSCRSSSVKGRNTTIRELFPGNMSVTLTCFSQVCAESAERGSDDTLNAERQSVIAANRAAHLFSAPICRSHHSTSHNIWTINVFCCDVLAVCNQVGVSDY